MLNHLNTLKRNNLLIDRRPSKSPPVIWQVLAKILILIELKLMH
jgi:hypothetical protein